MTNSAWFFLVAAWSTIFVCTGYCFYKLLFSARSFGGDDDES